MHVSGGSGNHSEIKRYGKRTSTRCIRSTIFIPVCQYYATVRFDQTPIHRFCRDRLCTRIDGFDELAVLAWTLTPMRYQAPFLQLIRLRHSTIAAAIAQQLQ